MNECLVTKLKSSVQDENLIMLGKITYTIPYKDGASNSHYHIILCASGRPVRITIDSTFVQNGLPYAVCEPNKLIELNAVPTGRDINVTIESVYDIRFIQVSTAFDNPPLGFESAFYNSDFRGFRLNLNEGWGIDLKDIKYLNQIRVLGFGEYKGVIMNPELIQNMSNLIEWDVNTIPLPISLFVNLKKLKFLNRFQGSINTLPLNINDMFISGNYVVGSLNSAIQSFISRGRLNGTIRLQWLTATNGVTINDISAKLWGSSNGVSPSEETYVSWTSDGSFTISNSKPSDFSIVYDNELLD